MGWTDTKPFSPAGQLRLVAAMSAAVFIGCAHLVWNQSSLLTAIRGDAPLTTALAPSGPVPTPGEPQASDDTQGIDFASLSAPNLWLYEDAANPSGWSLHFEDPELEPDAYPDGARTMGPFRATIWTTPRMGVWASTTHDLDHAFYWFGDTTHALTIPQIRNLIADNWTTGGPAALRAFRQGTHARTDEAPGLETSTAINPIGWLINAASVGALLTTCGLLLASFLIARRPKQNAADTATTEATTTAPTRAAA
ncbi:MAG: hypothetical protein ACF8Q5_11020 [Phycisphaerales bacterium JB040]